jgi:membrane-bound inhibitor of C-type lysozyme
MRMLFVLVATALAGCASITGSNERRVTYACERGADLVVVFDDGAARIVNPDGSEIVLPSRETGSGFLYETPTHSLRGQGTEAIYTIGRMAPNRCLQNNTADM